MTVDSRTKVFLSGALRWLMFIGMMAVGLWPILTTVVVADDLIGPFSMYVDAGPGLLSNLHVGFNAASYGHFNYVGQVIGGFINWFWLRLMIHGVRYSTIYGFTKFLMFVLVAIVAARVVRRLLLLGGSSVSTWTLRTSIGLVLIGTLQLHLVWSNDPVASYPMSGYASIVVGLLAIDMFLVCLQRRIWWRFVVASLALLTACLYYEMNVALFVTLGLVALVHTAQNWEGWRRAVRTIWPLSAVCLAPAMIVVILQHLNAAKSAQYTGTAVAFGGDTPSTFGRLLVSNLPFSSWHLGIDWVENVVPASIGHALQISVVAVLAMLILRKQVPAELRTRGMVLTGVAFLSLGAIATLVQAATGKVQAEATRIGSVYNFYAVGSTAVAVILAVSMIFVVSRWRRVAVVLLPVLVAAASFQFLLNAAIQERHYKFVPQNRNVLVAFTEGWEREQRCEALSKWLEMGWPVYYYNALVTGMDRAYLHFHGEMFCGRL